MFTLARLALRNLARNRRRTLLTLATLTVGVTAVTGVRGFLNGLQQSLVTGVAEGTVGAVVVHRKGYLASMEMAPLNLNMDIDPALLERIKGVPGVREVAPRIAFAGMLSVGDETVFSQFTGVDAEREMTACPKRGDAITGGHWMKSGTTEAMMGMELATALKATEGVSAVVMTGDIDGVTNAVEVFYAGKMAAGAQAEKKMALIPLRSAQELLRMPGKATELVVAVKELDRVDEVRDAVQALLGDTYEVHTWRDIATFVRDAQAAQNAALEIVTYIFMFIMLMGIANTLLMSVLERIREIGTMMAVGTRRRQILQLFLWEAMLIGALGAAIGSLIGFTVVSIMGQTGIVLLAPGASIPQRMVPYIQPVFLLRMVLLGSAGAVIAAIYPAWKASRMRPVQALASV